MLGDPTAATRAAPRTGGRPAERTRRPLEPLDEPPGAASRPARASAPPPQQRRRKKRNPLRGVFALVLLLAVVVLGVLAYQPCRTATDRAVQLREDVRGSVQDAVDEIKGLIEDNTR